jgi:fructoselysine-6-P-deglycase FrlB-like protein
MALIERDYPIIVLAPRGPAQSGLLALADDLRHRGARVVLAAPAGTPGSVLTLVGSDADDLDPSWPCRVSIRWSKRSPAHGDSIPMRRGILPR